MMPKQLMKWVTGPPRHVDLEEQCRRAKALVEELVPDVDEDTKSSLRLMLVLYSREMSPWGDATLNALFGLPDDEKPPGRPRARSNS